MASAAPVRAESQQRKSDSWLRASRYLLRAGGSILCLLGTAHLRLTYTDSFRGTNAFSPENMSLVPQLQATRARIAVPSGSTHSFWSAYHGFHASHSFGALIFGMSLAGWPAAGTLSEANSGRTKAFFTAATLFSSAYAIVAKTCWFTTPFVGLCLVTLCIVGAGFCAWKATRVAGQEAQSVRPKSA